MSKKLLICLGITFCGVLGYIEDHLPVLPAPQMYLMGNSAREVATNTLTLSIVNQSSSSSSKCDAKCHDILEAGFKRIMQGSFSAQASLPKWRLSIHPEMDAVPPAAPTAGLPRIDVIKLSLSGNSRGETVPAVGALEIEDEWYGLDIPMTGDVILKAKTVFGALHGFETLAQLSEWDDEPKRFTIGRLPLKIDDFPRFKWRGVMLDVARHFYPLKKLENFVDAIASMKMNVLHLHLSDAQSFAFKIDAIPTYEKAAFGKKAVYTHDEIKGLVKYARYRGVNIVPEIDIPAHTGSWRYFGDDIVANCMDYLVKSKGSYMENLLALNPAADNVWDTIKLVLSEVADTFDSPCKKNIYIYMCVCIFTQ